ncbi:MAG: hypothetical protein LC623_02400 [Halobacteriales archaeon]|nr:hypothetical protein [Halobacteriales archaeon]
MLFAMPMVQAEGEFSLEFAVPSQLGGDANVTGLEWALLIFSATTPAHAEVSLADSVSYTNYTLAQPRVNGYYMNATPAAVPYPDQRSTEPGLEAKATFAQQSSLFVQAEHLTLRTKAGSGVLDEKKARGCANDFLTESNERGVWIRSQCPYGQAVVLRVASNDARLGFELDAQNVRSVEWFGAAVSCTSSWCPDGGGQSTLTVPLPMGRDISDTTYSYSHLESPSGQLHAGGDSLVIVTGGSLVSADVQGWIRLAGAHATCSSCVDPANRTLSATGHLLLEALRVGSRPGILETQVAGDATVLRLDEARVDPGILPRLSLKAVVVGSVGIAIGVWGLAALFTRLVERKALRQPRRRLIHDYVRLHPGINRSELGAATAIPDTSLRHHLMILERSKLVTKRVVGKSVRLFPGKGVDDVSWQQSLLMRDPSLRLLQDWLKRHHGAMQKEALAQGKAWGWPRSTTQYRLGQLVRGGVVEAQKVGRTKRYCVLGS